MPGRTPHDALQAFERPLQRALSCLTPAVLDVQSGFHPGRVHPLTIAGGEPVRLSGTTRLALSMRLLYRIVETGRTGSAERWNATVITYIYTLHAADDAVLVSYHWHPEGRSPIITPHRHLGSSAVWQRILADAHLPTGVVTLADVVRVAIRDLGVRPLRQDWSTVLESADTPRDDER